MTKEQAAVIASNILLNDVDPDNIMTIAKIINTRDEKPENFIPPLRDLIKILNEVVDTLEKGD